MKTLKDYKDIEKMRAYRRRNRDNNYEKGDFREYKKGSRQFFTEGECRLIIEKKSSDRELAKLLGRSVKSVQIKRWKLLTNYNQYKRKYEN